MHVLEPSPPSVRTVRSENHIILLDWLRFLSAFLVVCCHARPEHWVAWNDLAAESHTWTNRLFFLLIRGGPEAVVIFFVLSGYLVGGKVIRRSIDGTFKPAAYFRDRASRIFTPLLPALILTLVCWRLVNERFPDGFWLQLLGNIFQMQGILCDRLTGNAPLWSLSYEVWFYIWAGTLSVILSRRPPVSRLIMATLFALLAMWSLVMLETTYLFCWVMGAGIYVFPIRQPRLLGLATGVTLTAAGFGISQATGTYQGGLVINSDALHKLGTLLLGGSIAFLIPALIHFGSRLSTSRWARLGPRLAAFSYTLYLTHFPLLLIMRPWHAPYTSVTAGSLLLYAIKILVCLIAAWLIYLPFERNTPQVRSFMEKLGRKRTPASPSAPLA